MSRLSIIDQGTQIDAYEFDVLGQTRFAGVMQFTAEQQAKIVAVFNSVNRPLELCGHEHEIRITQNYTATEASSIIRGRNGTDEQKLRYRTLVQTCLCDETYRRNQPLCAHASTHLNPSPYGHEITLLSALRILHETRWQCWYNIMRKQIGNTDAEITKIRYNAELNTPEYRTLLQRPVLQSLEIGRNTLLTCLERVGRECNIPLTTNA